MYGFVQYGPCPRAASQIVYTPRTNAAQPQLFASQNNLYYPTGFNTPQQQAYLPGIPSDRASYQPPLLPQQQPPLQSPLQTPGWQKQQQQLLQLTDNINPLATHPQAALPTPPNEPPPSVAANPSLITLLKKNSNSHPGNLEALRKHGWPGRNCRNSDWTT
eukprot:Filipodium_phascolosomae@DN523_c0_g1_i2.p1